MTDWLDHHIRRCGLGIRRIAALVAEPDYFPFAAPIPVAVANLAAARQRDRIIERARPVEVTLVLMRLLSVRQLLTVRRIDRKRIASSRRSGGKNQTGSPL